MSTITPSRFWRRAGRGEGEYRKKTRRAYRTTKKAVNLAGGRAGNEQTSAPPSMHRLRFRNGDCRLRLAPIAAAAAALLSDRPSFNAPASSVDVGLSRDYGLCCASAASISKVLTAKMFRDADWRTLVMQQRGQVGGQQLHHQSLDHCDSLGTCIGVGAGYPDRKVLAVTSATTRSVLSIGVVPDKKYASASPLLRELGSRFPGGTAKITCTDDLPNNKAELAKDLPGTTLTLDLKHAEGRVINTMNPAAQPDYGEGCARLARCFLSFNASSIRELKSLLTSPGGIAKGGRVLTKATEKGGKPATKTFKERDSLNDEEMKSIMDGSEGKAAFYTTFARNLQKDWEAVPSIQSLLGEMREDIIASHQSILTLGSEWREQRAALLEMHGRGDKLPFGFCVVKGQPVCAFTQPTIEVDDSGPFPATPSFLAPDARSRLLRVGARRTLEEGDLLCSPAGGAPLRASGQDGRARAACPGTAGRLADNRVLLGCRAGRPER